MPELTLDQAYELAQQHLRSGNFAEAEQIFRQLIAAAPAHPGIHNGLGESLQAQRRHGEALDEFDQAIALKSDYARAKANRASSFAYLGRVDEALAAYRETVQLVPVFPEGCCSIGNLLALKGDHPAAVAAYAEAIRLRPEFAEAYFGRGASEAAMGRRDEAEDAMRHAVQFKPDFSEAWVNLALMLESRRAWPEADDAFRRAAALRPDDAQLFFQWGNLLSSMGQHLRAVQTYQQAVRLDAANADAWNNLGIGLRMLGHVDGAVEAFRRTTQLRPAFAQAWSNLAVVLDLKNQRDDALACHRRAVEVAPDDPGSHDNLLYAMHFCSGVDPAALLAEHRRWNQRHAAPLASQIAPHPNNRNPDRPLRIGYVSPDFRDHPVGRFMLPLIAAHDPRLFEILCYADVLAFDGISQEIHRRCHGWRDITNLPDDQVANLVRLDQVDILVDLTMHMTGNRLLVLARKPAPVQVTYLAYPSTTGLDAIDYRLSDRWLDPDGTDDYVEKTIRLESYWCYAASAEAPAVNALPALSAGHVTFGCLNGFGKVSDAALAVWAKILLATPGSRLLLHANPGSHRDRTKRFLEERGVSGDRCEFVGVTGLADYFRHYHQIDIALDPFPYAGGTTTCDALWMGVPVVTLRGTTAVGRGGVSILSTLGIPEWIATTEEQYIDVAARLAADVLAVATWRAALRDRMRLSPLMDAPRFARNMEAAFRNMWKAWCAVRP